MEEKTRMQGTRRMERQYGCVLYATSWVRMINALVMQNLCCVMQVMYPLISGFPLEVYSDKSFIQMLISTFPWHANLLYITQG